MELVELKCKNCGANLEVDINVKEITCNFCHTKFSIESAENTGYEFEKGRIKAQKEELNNSLKAAKEKIITSGEKFSKVTNETLSNINEKEIEKAAKDIGKVLIIVVAFLFTFIFICIIGIGMQMHNASSVINKTGSQIDKFKIDALNTELEFYSGTNNLLEVKNALNVVAKSNRKNEYKITVYYKNIKIDDADQITDLKQSLNRDKYEVSFGYNKNKIINKMMIEDIE